MDTIIAPTEHDHEREAADALHDRIIERADTIREDIARTSYASGEEVSRVAEALTAMQVERLVRIMVMANEAHHSLKHSYWCAAFSPIEEAIATVAESDVTGK